MEPSRENEQIQKIKSAKSKIHLFKNRKYRA